MKAEKKGDKNTLLNPQRVVQIFLLCFLAFALRFYLIPQHLFFGPEQGKDMLVIKSIVHEKNLTLIGAKTDIDGVFHGPLYFYLSTIPFALSSGDPVITLGFFILLHALATSVMYALGRKLGNEQIGIISAVLFAVSYAPVVYARWLSSQPLAMLFSLLFFYTFYSFIKGRDFYLLFTGILFGLLVQIQFLNLVLFAAIGLILLIVYRERFIKMHKGILLGSFLVLLVTTFGNFVLFDIRHDHLISHNLMKVISGEKGYFTSFESVVRNTIQTYTFIITHTVFPVVNSASIFLIALLAIVVFFVSSWKNKKFVEAGMLLSLWIFTPLVLFIALKHDVLQHYLIPIIPAIILFTAFMIYRTSEKFITIGAVLLFVILIGNFFAFFKYIPLNQHIFFQENQPQLYLSDQKQVIDRIYKEADGQPFSFQSYTIPYWWQDGWSYLFWQYGEQKYGYYPVSEKARTLFVIIQDDPSGGDYQEKWMKNTVSQWGVKTEEFRYGILSVQKLHVL